MKTEQLHLDLLKNEVERTFRRRPGSPSDFNELSDHITETTNERLGISTLKRFWGYVKSPHSPTYQTLSVLARYAGFRDWHHFCTQLQTDNESGFSKDGIITAAELNIGDIVHVEWAINKSCVIRKIGYPSRFEVADARNIKLKTGDTLTIDIISVGEKFVASDCRRNGINLGTYIGARKEGVISCDIESPGLT